MTLQTGKGSIFVSGTDGDKGVAIVQQLLQLPEQYKHLSPQRIYAGLPDDTTPRAKSLKGLGAKVVAFDIFHDHQAAVKALTGMSKLCLLIDPLSERMQRSNAYHYGKAFIDAAKDAHVEHIIFLTPFTPLDPISPPVCQDSEMQFGSYRSQFMLIESYLHTQYDNSQITILRYPGVLHQHLLVFGKYIAQHNAFPLPDQHLEITVESCNMIDIARATACVAHSPTLRHGKNAYKISSGLLTLEEVSQRVLGGLERENDIHRIDLNALQQIICESIGNEDHALFLMEMWGIQQKLSGRRLEITRDLEALTGQSGKTLNEFLKEAEVRDAFLSHNNDTLPSSSKVA
ncbi:uncharacterized protein B0P05DRAFT_533747 [Gilbertella persicaria]|uniref:NmrA-like domain-containing protein n=1 Tax=Rhizopus stolonifer TaxID=4846 RepID=A0A367ITB7_RHIST|nr:uncharacterized protein B0P05DRAFT_533747 [Gilbertella persicaria]KAI8085791.1 hypothetical protein B0P05DRAFT_533747 [Gilbertella persicaria]RCH80923.1 hypothetical protein CU098_002178 [Rhizopus stolonifer]